TDCGRSQVDGQGIELATFLQIAKSGRSTGCWHKSIKQAIRPIFCLIDVAAEGITGDSFVIKPPHSDQWHRLHRDTQRGWYLKSVTVLAGQTATVLWSVHR